MTRTWFRIFSQDIEKYVYFLPFRFRESVRRKIDVWGALMTAAFTFPGQGSQAVGMGKALAEA
ncbi:MAG: hypothetical protein WBE54_13385, partial [Bradyrhizobium sp.]